MNLYNLKEGLRYLFLNGGEEVTIQDNKVYVLNEGENRVSASKNGWICPDEYENLLGLGWAVDPEGNWEYTGQVPVNPEEEAFEEEEYDRDVEQKNDEAWDKAF